jgi:phosphohistidine phosphatase
MLRLMLLRHAKAVSSAEYEDFERPLHARGKEDAIRMGAYMQKQGYIPELALISAAVRTQQTWKKLAFPHTRSVSDEALYLASQSTLLSAVHAVTAAKSVLLVAHNPGIAMLANILLGGGIERYPPCTLTVLDFAADRWEGVMPGEGMLIEMTRG